MGKSFGTRASSDDCPSPAWFRSGASDYWSRFVGPSARRSLPFSRRATAILIATVPADGKCRQIRCSLDQLHFRCRRRSRNATVHFEGSQHAVVLKRNVGRPIQTQPKLQSSASDRFRITLRVIGQQHHRHDVPYLQIDGCAHVIQNLRERCPHGDQIHNVFLSQQIRLLFASASASQRRPSAGPFGSAFVFSRTSHTLPIPIVHSKVSQGSSQLAACRLHGPAHCA